jgi:hypothetical protein
VARDDVRPTLEGIPRLSFVVQSGPGISGLESESCY